MQSTPLSSAGSGALPHAANNDLSRSQEDHHPVEDDATVPSPFAIAPNFEQRRISEDKRSSKAHVKDEDLPQKPLLPSKAAVMLQKVLRPQMGRCFFM